MKYTILINQFGIHKNGLADKTDVVDWTIIDYIKEWFLSEGKKKQVRNPKDKLMYTWINYKWMLEELPLLGVGTKKGLSLRIAKLRDLKLLQTYKAPDNTMYFRLTKIAMDCCFTSHTIEKRNAEIVNEQAKFGVIQN